jgi:hypothetical protein
MESLTNEEIRNRILEILYKNAKEEIGGWGIDRYAMLDILQVSEGDMDSNMLYLSRFGLVSIKESIHVLWHWAKISDFGINVYENKEKYTEEFLFLSSQTP